ncbi:phytanoyl-CoA dioxygenase family protein [Poriferisphaera sp. WC338]|uniref:phytanoyl-CoA dioxygenase family protein n=1 Tax=Poriferisphaera sp. WC338 TaxID=3425129 RepID=UPI003D8129EC
MKPIIIEPFKLDADLKLTQEHKDFFKQNGFLSLANITHTEDLDKVRVSYDRIFAEQAGRNEGNQFDLGGTDEDDAPPNLPQILHPDKYAPEMRQSALYANVQTIIQQFLGPEATTDFHHAILKPAGHGIATPWHQDAAYWDPNLLHKSVSIWTPLQEATLENGCMHFVPYTQNIEIVEHRHINNDPKIHALELTEAAMPHVKNVVACPLSPGGATIHNGYTLHYTPPNRSATPRRALILGGSIPATQLDKQRTFSWQENEQTARLARAAAANKNT